MDIIKLKSLYLEQYGKTAWNRCLFRKRMYQGTARCSSSRFLCCRLWRRFKENFPLCGALRHGALSVSPSGCSFAVCFSCFFPTGKPPDVGYDVRGLSFFRKDAQKGDRAKLSQVKGEIEVLPKKISRFFSEGLPKPKFCEAIIYERENARANGPDL